MQIIIYGTEEEKAFIKTMELFYRVKHTLKKDCDIDISARAENYIKSWISQNINCFLGVDSLNDKYEPNQIYGVIDGDLVYINNSVFDKVMSDRGFNIGKIRKDFKERNIFAKISGDSVTVNKKVKGKSTRCYCINCGEFEEVDPLEDLPFD